jgi:hypothetical protein
MNPQLVALLAAALFVNYAGAAEEAATPPRYSIKEDRPSTGSHIRRDQVTGDLPFDKTYAELTDVQRRMVQSQYEAMPESDEPPFPARGLGDLVVPLSRAHQKLSVTGFLSMHVYVDSTGTATKVDIMSSPSPELSKFAAAVAMQTKFKPAKCAGVPCAMGFPVRMTLDKRLH